MRFALQKFYIFVLLNLSVYPIMAFTFSYVEEPPMLQDYDKYLARFSCAFVIFLYFAF